MLLSFKIVRQTVLPIRLKIDGVKSSKGVVRVAVYNQATGFPNDYKKAVKFAVVSAKAGSLEIKLADVPTGNNAIVAYHDINNNNKLDVNLVGYPVEPYGVSNNARRRLSAPDFHEASINHKDSITVVAFELK